MSFEDARDLEIGVAAGNDETIPRAFLLGADALALCVAFVLTLPVASGVERFLVRAHPIGIALPQWLSVPATGGFEGFPPLQMLWVLALAAPLTVFFIDTFGGYEQLVRQSRTTVIVSTLISPAMALSVLTFMLFALKIASSSRVFIFTFGTISAAGLLGHRLVLRWYKKKRLASGAYAKNVILVGAPAAIGWMSRHFAAHVPPNQFRLAGWLRVGADETRPAGAERDDGWPTLLGPSDDLGALLVHRPIHEVIAIQSSQERDWLQQVIEDCDYFRVRLRIVPEALLVGTLRDLQLTFRTEPLRLPEVVLSPRHLETDALFLKRLMDIAISAALLVLLAPLFALIALAIKLTTPGLPVFYPWHVIGLKGRSFTGYKFTTMIADAEARRHDLIAQNEMQGPVFKVKDDPRTTAFGRILRKYSLNELPQLWSVLKGDMSLVGPRPAFRHELDRYELWHKRKLCFKPGITCLWQVSGRNRINSFDDWVRLDLQYIDEWSLWLDVRILARTAWAVVAGTGS